MLEDIDKEQLGDPYANAQYAKDIFDYMREREVGDACLGGLCGVPGGLFFFFFSSFWGVGGVGESLTSAALAGEVPAP